MADKQLVHARTAVYNVNYHFVWCVKYRRKVLVGEIENRLKQIFHEIAKVKGFEIKSMEIMPDHVHIFAIAHPKIAPGYMYKMLKGISGRRLFIEFPEIKSKLWKGRLWNPVTYTQTVGHVSGETILRYIEDQKSK
ncbi:MAG: IS200/IS605 family transposase [Desulfosalsimonas sp.]